MDELTQLIQAIESGNIDQVEGLLKVSPGLRRARLPSGISALLWALYNGQAAIAGQLAEGRTDLDVFESSALGRVERLAEILMDDRQQSNARAADGFQPLGLACFFRQPTAARLLLEAGADVNNPSNNPAKVTPLHSAAAADQVEIARLLLRRGADVNARQGGGFTPLHSAAQNGSLEMIKLLLVYGADLTPTSENGKTAQAYALEGGHAPAIDLLQIASQTRRVILRPHNPLWQIQFRQEAARLLSVFEPLLGAIYHIGSTSVPGLLAKPIIDILIEVEDIYKVDNLNEAMATLGYEAHGEYGIKGRRFFVLSENGIRMFHVHTYGIGNPEIRRHLAFRDFMCRHPDMAAAYADLKEELALRFVLDRVAYTDGKESFIREIDRLAAEEGNR